MRNHVVKLMFIVVVITLFFFAIAGISLAIGPGGGKLGLNTGDPNAVISSGSIGIQELSVTENFWTDDMLAEAQPYPWPDVTEEATADMTEQAFIGKPGAFFGEMPDPEVTMQILSQFSARSLMDEYPQLDDAPEQISGSSILSNGYNYPAPFTRYPGNSAWQTHQFYPYTTVGKLFFRVPGESSNYSCTAAVGYKSAIWTAGHCVYTPGKGWHTNMIFVPAYKNYGSNRELFGRFTIIDKATLNGWINNKQAYDIGMARVALKSGREIWKYTGYLGFAYNQSAVQHFHIIGYPSNFHDGRFTHICLASTARRDTQTGPDPIGVGCDMHQGSSGGPWIINFRPYVSGANNYVNSVVSYGYLSNKPLEFFGPYFGDGAKELYDWGRADSQKGQVKGKVRNAINNDVISGATVCAVSINRCTTTNGQGDYTISDVPVGSQNIKVTASGFTPLTQTAVVRGGETAILNFELSPTLTQGEMRIVLTWGANPSDLDSHLWLPASHKYHIFFSNKGSCSVFPYACLDVDDVTSYGPETITVKRRYGGTYKYAVFHYSGSGKLRTSQATVRVYDQNGLKKVYNVPASGEGRWWYVFDLDGSTGAITTRNYISSTDPSPYGNPADDLMLKKK